MGLIGQIFGTAAGTQAVGKAAETVAEVFVPNATKKMLAAEEGRKEIHSTSIRHKQRGAVEGIFGVGCRLGHGGHRGRAGNGGAGRRSLSTAPARTRPGLLSLWRAR